MGENRWNFGGYLKGVTCILDLKILESEIKKVVFGDTFLKADIFKSIKRTYE